MATSFSVERFDDLWIVKDPHSEDWWTVFELSEGGYHVTDHAAHAVEDAALHGRITAAVDGKKS